MNPTRPKNLNLFTIKQPIPAIVSILHRISGFILLLLLPFLIWGLSVTLTEQGFNAFQAWRTHPLISLLFWLLFAPFIFHLIAGIRHLFMDVQVGVSLRGGRVSAALTLLITTILVILAGIWLW